MLLACATCQCLSRRWLANVRRTQSPIESTLRTLPAPDRLYPVFAIACPAFMYKHEAATATATAIVATTAATAFAFAFATTAAAATTEL